MANPKRNEDEVPTGLETRSPTANDPIDASFKTRLHAGYFLAIIGILSAAGGVVLSAASFSNIEDLAKAPEVSATELGLVILGHAAVAITSVLFGYSLVRAGERLLLPRSVVADSHDVELVRALLGKDPISILRGNMKGFLDQVTKLARATAEIVAAAQGKAAPPPE